MLATVTVGDISIDLASYDRTDRASRRPRADRPPDVILIATGSALPGAEAMIAAVVQAARPTPVLVLSDFDDQDAVLTVLRTGASGYLLDEASDEELAAALHRIAKGQIMVDPSIAGRIVAQVASGTWRGGPSLTTWRLTPREREVLDSLIECRTNRQIAQDLILTPETVKTHLRALYRKLGARDRTHAVAITLGRQPPGRPDAS